MKAAQALAPVLLLAAAAAIASARSRPIDYPLAPRDQISDDYFGTRVEAPYRWMENMQSPGLHDWVDAQNRLTDGYL
ncbi:MAG: S9 family peptidase, partial [Steroidobacteraceae bacterium]